jgi:hypothetical protein
MFQSIQPETQAITLEWIKTIFGILLSWQVLGFIAILFFRKPVHQLFEQFTKGDLKKMKVGEIEFEREINKLAEQGQQAVSNLNRTNELMAESRLLELEITRSMFGGMFSEEQRKTLLRQIEELRTLTRKAE